MKQVLINSTGALVARVPVPRVEIGGVLVRTRYSLISVGTEIATLLPQPVQPQSASARVQVAGVLARSYLGKAIRDPRKAARRVAGIIAGQARRYLPERESALAAMPVGELRWNKAHATSLQAEGNRVRLVTDGSEFLYQALTQAFDIPEKFGVAVELAGELRGGPICVGLLSGPNGSWIGNWTLEPGRIDEKLVFDAGGSLSAVLVVANAGAGIPVELDLSAVRVEACPAEAGLPHSEMDQQGWGVGYSAAGEVVAVGEGVADIAVGQWVACCGAGKANHAEYISAKRNMVCPVPRGCDLRWAATTTVGTIALQGVRRAQCQLGERVAVIGLGLIGQMTAQMLRAAGCLVIGLDLNAERVERAKSLGMDHGAADADAFRQIVRDLTGGRGVDRTLITAATKSNALINLSMEVTRAKGTVVIVGDIGLAVERAQFYRKEIDLLMSTSYGAGRYDRRYEDDGIDYPFPYVRWTINRNMASYMELIATGRLNIEKLIDRIVPVGDAPQVYRELVDAPVKPLGVLFEYLETAEEARPGRITLRGHRKAQQDVTNYVLVGAGAFGISMLVPQMNKRRDRFFLRGVVSQDPVRGGNFARANNLEILATDISAVLDDPSIQLVVIATRHDQHARQAIAALRAGKHVFVEKPLALSWAQLDEVVQAYSALPEKPLLMVGFNRRFSPAVQRLRKELEERRSPLIINYRINGGYIPLDHWVQGKEGGGRNIGEACHMYDVFRALAGSPVASIQAAPIDPQGTAYLRSDNFCATLTYEDGSVGNLVYTAMGPKTGLPKERIEVFCDGKAYIVDDFKALLQAGAEQPLWESTSADKGHFEQLSRFGDALASGGEAPIPFEEIVETSAAALRVEDLLFSRIAESE
jgi:predicted dehydrogenase